MSGHIMQVPRLKNATISAAAKNKKKKGDKRKKSVTIEPKDRKRGRSKTNVMVFQDVARAKGFVERYPTRSLLKRMGASGARHARSMYDSRSLHK
jgi:hypothetical protein